MNTNFSILDGINFSSRSILETHPAAGSAGTPPPLKPLAEVNPLQGADESAQICVDDRRGQIPSDCDAIRMWYEPWCVGCTTEPVFFRPDVCLLAESPSVLCRECLLLSRFVLDASVSLDVAQLIPKDRDVLPDSNGCHVAPPLYSPIGRKRRINERSRSVELPHPKRARVSDVTPHAGNEKLLRREEVQRSRASKKRAKRRQRNMFPFADEPEIDVWEKGTRKKTKKHVNPTVPHSCLTDVIDVERLRATLDALGDSSGMQLDDSVVSYIEGFALLLLSIAEAVSTTQALNILLLYLKSHFKTSLVSVAYSFVKEVLNSDDIVPQDSAVPAWLLAVRSSMTNWKLFSQHTAFRKMSYLCSCLVTLGLCEQAKFDWNLCGIKLFSVRAQEKHVDAYDLMDAVFETVTYFVEGGYMCFTKGSLAPILYSDHRAIEFEEKCNVIFENAEHVKTGNLQKFTGMDDNAFGFLISEVLDIVQQLQLTAKGSWEKKYFQDRQARLMRIRAEFQTARTEGGLREAPYCVNFCGASGVGKSSVSAISMATILASNGYKATDDMLITLNDSEKYMSNMKTHINGIHIDDMNNTDSRFVEKAPTTLFIEIINNVRRHANMADIDQKGKVSIEPKCVMVTTNTKDLGAHTYSNEPGSIARRANLTVTVTVRSKFCSDGLTGFVGAQLDSQKVMQAYTHPITQVVDVPMFPDIWALKVERVVLVPQTDGRADAIAYQTVVHRGVELGACSIKDFLDYAIDDSRRHFQSQADLVARSSNIANRLIMCPVCKKPTGICDGCEPEIEPHSGILFHVASTLVVNKVTRIQSSFMKAWEREDKYFDKWATQKLIEYSRDFDECWFMSWTNWIPTRWLKTTGGRHFIYAALRDDIVNTIKRNMLCTLWLIFAISFVCWWCGVFMLAIPCVLWLAYRITIQTRVVKEQVYSEILRRNDCVPILVKKHRENAAKAILGAFGVGVVIYSLVRLLKPLWYANREKVALQKTILPHGNLLPKRARDIEERDAEVNPWVGAAPTDEIPTSHKQRTIIPEELLNLAYKNLCLMRVRTGHPRVTNAFFPCSNVVVFPYHILFPDADLSQDPYTTLDVTFEHSNNHTFAAVVGLAHTVRIPDSDFCISWVPSGGEWRDLRDYLPIGDVSPGSVLCVCRTQQNEKHEDTAWFTPCRTAHSTSSFFGGNLKYGRATFGGMCMAPLISQTKGVVIAGFHLGGRTGDVIGVAGTLTQAQFSDALAQLSTVPGVLLSHNMGDMPHEQYGVPILASNEVHRKSAVNFIEPHYGIHVYGSTGVRATAISSVVVTPISPLVTQVFGVPCKFGKPKFKKGWPFYESLKYSAHPSPGVPPDLLVKATQDYLEPVLDLLKIPGMLKYVRPLSKMECLCGIDGVRFIDAIPLTTSQGFPLSGPKRDVVVDLDPLEYTSHQCPRELNGKFWEVVAESEEAYLAGNRSYGVFKACLKDEPTSLEKDKVRVFQAAPLAMSLGIRKYFLPLARVLSMSPLISECAVGVNCQGPEWSQLVEHITYFGRDRMLAGDYSKYDLRMPAQLMLAAFSVFISMAERSGRYSCRDLVIMRGLATDVTYAVTAFDGTLLKFLGSNPSGHNLTVYINSIANSLLFRCGYFYTIPDPPEFRQACALITYGDDACSSVSSRYPEFNHITLANFLAKCDIVFTMPDKTSTPTEYMEFENVDFLKRRDVYHPKLGISFGALDEDSIFKSLHTVLKSKAVTLVEQCSQNMDGALREWFFHGEEVYEDRRAQMRLLSREAKISVQTLDLSYDDRLIKWCEQYDWALPDLTNFGEL